VIKGSATPAIGGVAGTATGSELTIVMVIGSVAGITVRRRSFVNSVGMAGLAVDSGVPAS